MKKIDTIEKEYEEYKIKTTFLDSPEALASFVQVGIEDTINIEQELINEQKENKRWQLAGKIRNFFFFIFEEEEISFYDEDNEILQEGIDLTIRHRNFYTQLVDAITLDNYKELIKLCDFGTDYYNKHIEYFDSRRDSLESSYKGFTYINSKAEDNIEVVFEFLDKKINELSKTKPVEKGKKIC